MAFWLKRKNKEKGMETYNWQEISAGLNKLLRLKSTPVGIKFFEKKAGLEQISKLRYLAPGSEKRFSVCMLIGQALYNNWTVAVLPEYIPTDYCRTIHGLFAVDEKFKSGKVFAGIWHCSEAAAKAHNNALTMAPPKYEAMAVSPLAANRIQDPQVCLLYLTPGQLFMLLSGYLYSVYEKLNFSFVGESECSESWVKALVTGRPAVSIPSFAERKFGGVQDDEMALALSPAQLARAVAGTESLNKNGLRYPIPPFGISNNMLEGLPKSYTDY
jgi:uncharacterized protein (DUF169 family)